MNERNLERPTNHEQELKPKVLVTFHGVNHHFLNLEGIKHTKETLERHLLNSQGVATVVLEGGDVTQTLAERYKKDIKTFGGIGNLASALVLRGKNRREPSLTEAMAHKNTVAKTDLDTVINSGLIPFGALRIYYEWLALDHLSQDYNLEFDFETQPKKVQEKDAEITTTYETIQQQTLIEQWTNGDFSHVIENWKTYCQMDISLSQIREAGLAENLKSRIRKIAKLPEGGSVFLIFGATHSPMMETLERKIGPKEPVKFVIDAQNNSSEIILPSILLSLRKSIDIPDERYAQEVFYRQLFQTTYVHFERDSKISAFAYNFESIEKILNKLALQTSLEEIRRICEEKVDLLEYLKKSPLAQDALEIADQNPKSQLWTPGSSTSTLWIPK